MMMDDGWEWVMGDVSVNDVIRYRIRNDVHVDDEDDDEDDGDDHGDDHGDDGDDDWWLMIDDWWLMIGDDDDDAGDDDDDADDDDGDDDDVTWWYQVGSESWSVRVGVKSLQALSVIWTGYSLRSFEMFSWEFMC